MPLIRTEFECAAEAIWPPASYNGHDVLRRAEWMFGLQMATSVGSGIERDAIFLTGVLEYRARMPAYQRLLDAFPRPVGLPAAA